MFIFVLILCLKITNKLSLRLCKVNHYFSDYQVFTAFFYVFNSIVFLLEYLCVFFLFLLNLVYFMILDKRKEGTS
mgnify:CR=1